MGTRVCRQIAIRSMI